MTLAFALPFNELLGETEANPKDRMCFRKNNHVQSEGSECLHACSLTQIIIEFVWLRTIILINKAMNFDVIYNKCMSAFMLSSLQLYSAGFIALVVLQLQYDSIFFKFSLILS